MKTTSADKWFSCFIRLRDTDDDGMCHCFTCNVQKPPKYMEVGHYVKRQNMGSRFSEMDHAQCKNCNWQLQGNDAVYRPKLVEMYGEDKVLLMEAARRETRQLKAYQLKELAKIYKEKTNQLLKEKGIQKWW